MSRDYRAFYCEKLGVKLKRGIGSVHHLNFQHFDSKISNLVGIPESLHREINLIHDKFPKTIKNIIREGNYNLPRKKHLEDLRKQVYIYSELLKYIEIKKMILSNGLEYAKSVYKEETELIYETEKG
jgi:hypothetical protein